MITQSHIPIMIAANDRISIRVDWCVCVFTSAMLELHLLFIRVLLGFDISTVPEKKCTAGLWSCIGCLFFQHRDSTALQHICGRSHILQCVCAFALLNLQYFQENPILLFAQPIGVCMNNCFLLSHAPHFYDKPGGKKTKNKLFLFFPVFTCQSHTSL